MSYLVDLHEAGHLLAAGPLMDDQFRGLSILGVAPEEARRLMEQDPAVHAGRLGAVVMPWLVPAGAMTFAPAHFPRSVSEIEYHAAAVPGPCRREGLARYVRTSILGGSHRKGCPARRRPRDVTPRAGRLTSGSLPGWCGCDGLPGEMTRSEGNAGVPGESLRLRCGAPGYRY